MTIEEKLIQAYSETLTLYHEAYAAHHGENGPDGCPCCAEYKPRIQALLRETLALLDEWLEQQRGGPVCPPGTAP